MGDGVKGPFGSFVPVKSVTSCKEWIPRQEMIGPWVDLDPLSHDLSQAVIVYP